MSYPKTAFGNTYNVPEADDNNVGPDATAILDDLLDVSDGLGFITGSGIIIPYRKSTTSTLAAAATMTPTHPAHKVQGSGGPVTLSGTTAIADGQKDGQLLTLQGDHATNTVSILNGSNVRLRGDITLGQYEAIDLRWDAAVGDWIEIAPPRSFLNQQGVDLFEATANGTNKITLRAPASLAADSIYTFPATPVAGQFLISDGSGNLSFSPGSGTLQTAYTAGSGITIGGGNPVNLAKSAGETLLRLSSSVSGTPNLEVVAGSLTTRLASVFNNNGQIGTFSDHEFGIYSNSLRRAVALRSGEFAFDGPSPWIDIMAKGASIALSDNGPAIQAAHDALPAAGGVLYVPPGTFNVTTGITFTKKVTLKGCGPDNSKLKWNTTGATDLLAYNFAGGTAPAEWFSVDGVGFEGNGTSHTGRGIFFSNPLHIAIRRCRFYNFGGVAMEFTIEDDDNQHISIRDCHIYFNVGGGVRFNESSHDIVIDNCMINQNGFFGVMLKDSRDVRIQGCEFAGYRYGISPAGATHMAVPIALRSDDHTSIVNCRIENHGGDNGTAVTAYGIRTGYDGATQSEVAETTRQLLILNCGFNPVQANGRNLTHLKIKHTICATIDGCHFEHNPAYTGTYRGIEYGSLVSDPMLVYLNNEVDSTLTFETGTLPNSIFSGSGNPLKIRLRDDLNAIYISGPTNAFTKAMIQLKDEGTGDPPGIFMVMSNGAGVTRPLEIQNAHDGHAVHIEQSGDETALWIDQSAAGNKRVAEFTQGGNAVGLFIDKNGAASGAPLLINNAGTGKTIDTDSLSGGATGAHLTAAGVWTDGSTCHRRFKTNIENVDPLDVLARVRKMAITRFNFNFFEERGIHQRREWGPMMEDLIDLFDFSDEGGIGLRELCSISLAAVQGLAMRLEAAGIQV